MANINVSREWMEDNHPDKFDELMSNFRDEVGAGLGDSQIIDSFKVKFFRDSVSKVISCSWEGSIHTYTPEHGWQPV